MKKLFVILLSFLICFLMLGSTPNLQAATSSSSKTMIKLINKERTKRGKKKLVLDKKLTKVANARAKEIKKSFSHTRPDGSSCFTIFKKYKINIRAAGENIAYGQPTAKRVMSDWMHSAGHKANILRNSFGHVGIGRYQSGSTIYWVQIFSD